MGVAIPQVVTEDRAGGAQVIDGSLRFDSSKTHYLSRTPASAGNRKTYTFSCWVKKCKNASGDELTLLGGLSTGNNNPRTNLYYDVSTDVLVFDSYNISFDIQLKTNAVFRDNSAWAHVVLTVDTTQATSTNRVKLYINNVEQTFGTATYPSPNFDTHINAAAAQFIGSFRANTGYFNGHLANVYFIDGQALDPSYFGFTDPLTNTWRPKKLSSSVAFGTNGFYLPLDGNTPIGQDRSGRGNNWTPVNFGGSNTIEKATGALPILNTDGGGKVARVGVRTDSSASSLVLALPLVGIKSDFSNAINSGTSNKATTVTTSSFSSADSIFYGGSLSMASGYVTVTDSSDFNFGTGSYTVECWVNVTSGGASGSGFVGKWYAGSQGTTNSWLLYRGTNGALYWVISADGTNGTNYTTAASTVPTNKWVHCAACYDSSTTTLRLFIDGVLAKTESSPNTPATVSRNVSIGRWDIGDGTWSGYIQDVRIYKGLAKYTQNFIPASTDPDILPDTPSGVAYSSNVALVPSTDGAVAFDGSGDYLSLASSADFAFGTGDFTIEAFCYRQPGKFFTLFDHLVGVGNFTIFAYADDVIQVYNNAFLSSGVNPGNNKWFHLAVVRQSGVLSFYIDGIKASNTHSFTFNFTTAGVNIGVTQYAEYSTGFISNLHVVKGTALYTSNFTPPTAPISSVANTKLLCCKSNSSATAFDVSPGAITANGNAYATNFNPFNVNINTQRGQESGYCTLNPLQYGGTVNAPTNGNLNITSASSGYGGILGTIGMSAGKWYFEFVPSTTNSALGIAKPDTPVSSYLGQYSGAYIYLSNGNKANNNSYVSYANSFTSGDTIGVSFDADNGILIFYKNGISQGTAYTGLTSGPYLPAFSDDFGSAACDGSFNFGQKPFKFPPPAGFQPLALANLPRPTIVRPDQFVGIVTYTGNGVSGRKVSGYNFKPDLIWIKRRDPTAGHIIQDTIRGSSVYLGSDSPAGDSSTGGSGSSSLAVQFFDRDGFTLGTGAGVNASGGTYVGWCWKAGGNSNTFNINDIGYSTAAAAGLTAGTITPTDASVNTKSGFSIVTWTGNGTAGATVSHGLGAAPSFIILKRRSGGGNSWGIYHSALGATKVLQFDTNSVFTDTTSWNDTSPTSTVFYLGTSLNTNTGTYVAYCWAEIPGFSKFGIYTGNGSADGVTVITGFRPAVVLMKKTSASSNWFIHDSGRNKYNAMTSILFPNLSDQEDNTYGYIDFLSNGFKLRFQNTDYNTSSATYIYAAYAEAPAQNLFGGQSNAR